MTYICVKRIKFMVQSKTELFDKDLQECAVYFKVLAHPARLQILQYLAETKTCITGDISDVLPLGRTTVNQHLKELKDAGLIKGETEGVKVNYCLNITNLKKAEDHFLSFFGKILRFNTPDNNCK